MPTLRDVAKLLGLQSERKMAAQLGLNLPISTLKLIRKYEQIPPKARFSVAPTEGVMPLHVIFTDQSLGYVTKREWAFGGGATSSDPNPPFVYPHPVESYQSGDFALAGCLPWEPTLTVSNKAGSDTATTTVTVYPARPVAKFSADHTSGPAPLTVNFGVDRSAGYCITAKWNFGDPNSGSRNLATTSGQEGATHKYNDPGSYNMVLEVTNSAGMSFGGATIVATGIPASESRKNTPYIIAGRDPNYSTIKVSGSRFTKGAAITINVPSCGSGGDGTIGSFTLNVVATEAGGPPSNSVAITCWTSTGP